MTVPLYRVIIGNVVGVVEEPETLDLLRPLENPYRVKIGAVDHALPLDASDARAVIVRLRQFAARHVADGGAVEEEG